MLEASIKDKLCPTGGSICEEWVATNLNDSLQQAAVNTVLMLSFNKKHKMVWCWPQQNSHFDTKTIFFLLQSFMTVMSSSTANNRTVISQMESS